VECPPDGDGWSKRSNLQLESPNEQCHFRQGNQRAMIVGTWRGEQSRVKAAKSAFRTVKRGPGRQDLANRATRVWVRCGAVLCKYWKYGKLMGNRRHEVCRSEFWAHWAEEDGGALSARIRSASACTTSTRRGQAVYEYLYLD
jgi:hypothetical protein